MHEAATGAEDLNWGLTFLALAYYTLGLKNELSILSPQSSEPGSVSFWFSALNFGVGAAGFQRVRACSFARFT